MMAFGARRFTSEHDSRKSEAQIDVTDASALLCGVSDRRLDPLNWIGTASGLGARKTAKAED